MNDFYLSPQVDEFETEYVAVLCTSGELDDFTIDDFDWEGIGHE